MLFSILSFLTVGVVSCSLRPTISQIRDTQQTVFFSPLGSNVSGDVVMDC